MMYQIAFVLLYLSFAKMVLKVDVTFTKRVVCEFLLKGDINEIKTIIIN
jgi:hypothetical protein